MAAPNIKTGGIATYSIKVGGNAIPDELSVLSVHIEKKVNSIPVANIIILDGSADTGTFDASSSATFVPGAEITIDAGYDNTNSLVFKGIITAQSIRIDSMIGSTLEVACIDAAVKMTAGRKNGTFSGKKDSDIISSVIGTYPGLSANVTATTVTWPQQVQYYATDWDFIQSLAEANGMVVTALNGKVSVLKPGADTTPVITVGYGDGLIEFNATLNATNQLGSVKASSWDYATQAINYGEAINNFSGPGNISSEKLSEVIGLTDYQLQTPAYLPDDELTTWSQAQLVKSEYSKIQGVAKFQGTSLVNPAKYITLQGLGNRFNGDHFISEVAHDLSDGNWTTRVSIGLSPEWLTSRPHVMAPSASGLIPGARGLFTGTVKQMSADPSRQFRILVDVPMFGPAGTGIWARLSNFYATNGAGAFFMPELDTEVVLGFLNEDPRYPVILGSLYSTAITPPYTPDEKNTYKAIATKSQLKIEFDDVNKITRILTPQNNTITLSDKDKSVNIADQNGNKIMLSPAGISINSASTLEIKAAGNIKMSSGGDVTISATGNATISGSNFSAKADMQATVQGGASAQLTASGEVSVKGAMVMIN